MERPGIPMALAPAAPTAPAAIQAAAAPAAAARPAGARDQAMAGASRWALAFAAGGLWKATAKAGKAKSKAKTQRQALESMGHLSDPEILQQVQQFWHHVNGDAVPAADLAAALQHWADSLSQGAGHLAQEIVPPAYAAEVELDPNTTYLYGPDGAVLLDPMNQKPLADDWWNGFIGFQKDIIKSIDQILRDNGVEQAFGWTIVLYTAFIKVLFFPLQQGQLKSTSMMQLLKPKMDEIQAKYKDDPDTQQRLMAQLYGAMDVNPLGGCLPVLLQLPIFWSLYGVWRRLAAEKFPHYTEGWLWVPSLAQPNPDFQFKLDWLFKFQDGQPEMGWSDYLAYLVFPAILVGSTILQQQQAASSRPKTGNEDDPQNVVLQVLPWISVYFIGSLSLELPQAVSVYYSMNTALTLVQTQVAKWGLRQEIPGYEEFERTGKFPEKAFEDMLRATVPPPTTLHEACLRGEVKFIDEMLDALTEPSDINKWDEKKIAPLGYAVACGHMEAVKRLLERGADVTLKDGQENTFLHYAAGYGHLDVLKELLVAADGVWPEDSWKDLRNGKGQNVLDAARVNRKGPVVDFLCERLGLDVETVKMPEPVPAPSSEGDAEARARAAMLAAAGGTDGAAGGAPKAAGAAQANAATMRQALEKLKSNPEAVEQAKKMMGQLPPGMVQMLSGGKISEEEAKKAMSLMSEMSTEDLMKRVETVSNKMETVPPAEASPGSKPARSVD